MRPLRLLALVLLLCPMAHALAGPGAHWRQGWNLAPRPDPATAAAAPPPLAVLRLEGAQDRWRARIDNVLAGPVQVTLRPQPGTPAVPGLPLQRLLPAAARVVVADLPLPPQATALRLELVAVPGDPAARPRDVAYRLPFDAARIQVSQGPQGRFSHEDAENRDAVDFALPEGTPVLAARAGTVMQVQAGFRANGLDRQHDLDRANLIRILHEDGSMAVYAHLQADGVRVRPGQQVDAGQPIGRSGNTGFSTAPHLHFAVQVNAGMRLRSIPVRVVAAQGELRFARHSAGSAADGTPATP